PAHGIAARDAPTEHSSPSLRNSTPVPRVPVNVSLTAGASVRTVRFLCPITGRRYATAGLHRLPPLMFRFIGPTPSGSGPFRSSRYGMPEDRPASRNAAATGGRFLARSAGIGPPAPRTALPPASHPSPHVT